MVRPQRRSVIKPASTLALAFLLAALLGLAGCLTPSVPIPPPAPEKMSFSVNVDDGTARYSYDTDPSFAGAVVYVFNRSRGIGIITTADAVDGSVAPTEPFRAALGDQVVVTFELDGELASTCVELREGRLSSQFECRL